MKNACEKMKDACDKSKNACEKCYAFYMHSSSHTVGSGEVIRSPVKILYAQKKSLRLF
jgi:hypothetical protein